MHTHRDKKRATTADSAPNPTGGTRGDTHAVPAPHIANLAFPGGRSTEPCSGYRAPGKGARPLAQSYCGEQVFPAASGEVFAVLRHLFTPSNPRLDLCSIVFVVLGRDRKPCEGRSVRASSN